MYLLAVLGNPIAHSLSPTVFSLFAKQFNLELHYDKILIQDGADFKNKVTELFTKGYVGLNVTSPFKQQAYEMAAMHTARSGFCQAANFLCQAKDNCIIADTTDGLGLITDIQQNHKFSLDGKNILILGSGYVLDSILLDLVVHNPITIDILARNSNRVNFLGAKFGTGVFDPQKNYDLILNSSPNIAENNLFEQIIQLNDSAFCCDLTYNNNLFTKTMLTINPHIKTCNGLGMLVEQAKVAFIKLFNKIPNTQIVFEELSRMGHNV